MVVRHPHQHKKVDSCFVPMESVMSYGIGDRVREKMSMTVLLFCAALTTGVGVCLLRTISVNVKFG